MSRPLTLAFVIFGGALLHPSIAVTQDIPSSYRFVETRKEAGIFVGSTSLNAGQLGLGPASGSMVGGRYALGFGSALALEGSATFFSTDRDVIDIRRDAGDRVIGQSSLDILAIEARFRLNLTGHRTWRGLQPYVAFGGGLAFGGTPDRTLENAAEIPLQDRFEFGTKFIATVAGGLNFHTSRRFVLRLDGVLSLWKLNTPAGWLTQFDLLGAIPRDEWVGVSHVSLGVSWRY